MFVNPLAEKTFEPYSYTGNNPIMFTDPTGMKGESTHTDLKGNVIAVYDDGDNGVYKHQGNGNEAKKFVENNYNKKNTSSGGEKMGESLHLLSFADQNLYNKKGGVRNADIKIDFNSNQLTNKVKSALASNPLLMEYQLKGGTNGDWDFKS